MKRSAVLFAALIFVAGASGCKTTSSAESTPEKKASGKSEKAGKSERAGKREKAGKPAPANIPADSPFAKIKMGMHQGEVDELLGDPTSTRNFPSGKAFNPFYYGPDTIRTGALYKGLGRIVFSGAHIVVEIEYDPTEDGY